MQKILFSIFVGIGYGLQALKKPATWAAIALLVALLWWKGRHAEAGKVVHREAPIEFKPLAADGAAPAANEAPGTVAAAASDEIADAIAAGVTDPEKLPVMSSRQLEVAVGRFHKDNLRLPNDADELIAQKYLVGVPPAPPGKRYVLDLSPIQMRLVSK
ncbi:MAG: hypothetical protein HZA92_16005 [Verrucomicrobia bacterium]|nr:hypothetical protein [Verrucomicrobiota bacterium]